MTASCESSKERFVSFHDLKGQHGYFFSILRPATNFGPIPQSCHTQNVFSRSRLVRVTVPRVTSVPHPACQNEHIPLSASVVPYPVLICTLISHPAKPMLGPCSCLAPRSSLLSLFLQTSEKVWVLDYFKFV